MANLGALTVKFIANGSTTEADFLNGRDSSDFAAYGHDHAFCHITSTATDC